MIKGAVFQKHFNTQTETNHERLGEVCMREVNAIPRNVAARFTSPICPLTAWQKVNICISRVISNFPTKSWLCYDHGRLPKDARYIKQTHLICLCLKTVGRAPSDHERQNWIIHIVHSHTFPSQTKLTRRAVNNFNIVRRLHAQHCLDVLKGREKKTKPQNLPSIKGCWSTVRNAAIKHHLKTYRAWAFLRISGKIQESCHSFYSDAAMLCGFHL